jgi:hypothetical protein
LVAAPLVGTTFRVFVATGVADVGVDEDNGSLVEVVSDVPQADKTMDAMKSRENIFFMM